jgi:glycine betaine catabolism B
MNTIASPSRAATRLSEVNTNTWVNGRHQVRCARVTHETADVKTFAFVSEQPLLFFFKPGQFVSLELEIDGQPVMRSYTISSSPSKPYGFSITIKRVPGGLVSNWLHDNLREGDNLHVHGPAGLFNIIDFPARKVLMLSGGVGITPVMSMSRWLLDTCSDVDIAFIHSARTPADIIFQRELEDLSARNSNFHLHLVCERSLAGYAWGGYRGYLDAAKLAMMVPDLLEREVFCCGPQIYMDAVKNLLTAAGFDPGHYHDESFGSAPAEAPTAAEVAEQMAEDVDSEESNDSSEALMVEFTSSGKQVQLKAGETVHAAAGRLGMYIPKACGMGICGTCKVRKTSGEVEMHHNGGITDEDVADGYILSCCSVPTTSVVIEH